MQLLQDTSRINVNEPNSVKTRKKLQDPSHIKIHELNSVQLLKIVFISNKMGTYKK
jgi:hypothetical protein